MAEYIEREALINVCKEIIQDKWNEKACPVSWSHAYADFIDDIENQPAADVVPVVRCKDCRWYGQCFRNIRSRGNKPDDYCSYGERKELENETPH